jgi:AcrR family transcriptional regulator
MQSALTLFAEKGYVTTGVAEVCTAADVSKGAFYHHFPSKQAIFIELLQEWLQGLDGELSRAMTRSSNVPDALMAMASEMRGVFDATDGRLQLFLEFWQQARRDPQVWKELIAPYRRYREYFAQIIEKGIAEGSLPRQDPQAAAHALVALAVGLVVQGVLDPAGAEWFRVMQDAIRLLISGLVNAESGADPGGR